MKERIVTGIILVLAVFGFLLYASDYLFGVGVFLVALLAAYEWLRFIKLDDKLMIKGLVVFAVVTFIVAEFFVYLQYVFPIFWVYAIFKLSQYEKEKIDSIDAKEMFVMGVLAIAPFSGCLYILHSNNVAWIFMFILVVAAADSGAYFTGKSIGKRKLLPRLSPNKTIEGLVGGLICAMIVAVVFLAYMDLSAKKYVYMMLISAIVAVLSVVGDVFESMMKRIAGVKDSGNILPGHGGVLDRLDGYMPTLPIFVMLGYFAGVFVF